LGKFIGQSLEIVDDGPLTNFLLQGAWDSYIQGTGGNNIDPSIWPMNFDMTQMGDAPMPQQQQQQQQGQSGGGASGSNIFMGSGGNTPNNM
jgi:hypothetical protein